MNEPQIVMLGRGDLAVWTFGDGPDVLVLHGFPDHAIGMRSLAEALAASGFRAIVPALPGYAPSAVPADGDLSMGAVARDVVALLDHLGIDRAHVVGHDWGGIVGYRLGAEQPERLASLTALAVCHDAGFAVRRSVLREQQTGAYAWVLAYASARAEIAADPAFITAAANDWSPGLHRADWPDVLAVLTRPEVAAAVSSYYRTRHRRRRWRVRRRADADARHPRRRRRLHRAGPVRRPGHALRAAADDDRAARHRPLAASRGAGRNRRSVIDHLRAHP